MPLFPSLPDDAGPPAIFAKFPELFGRWSAMSELMMNGPSELTQGERELLASFVAGVAGCRFVEVAHSEVAYEWGIEEGLVAQAVADLDAAPVDDRLRPVLAFARKLVLAPAEMTQADADAVFDAGWSEQGLHDIIFITGRIRFMQCLVEGHGFTPMSKETARQRAKKRVEVGYVNLYPEFRTGESSDGD